MVGVDLPAVGVALDGRVEYAEAALRWMQHFARQQDAAGAGGETGRCCGKLAERGKESVLLKELEHSRRFAAGNDESVEADSSSALRTSTVRAPAFANARACAS